MMGSSPVVNQVCWGSVSAIPLNLTIPQALFYLGTRGGGGPDEMAVVTIDPGPPLSVGNPEVLFDRALYRRGPGEGRMHDIAPDGQRFLMLAEPGTARETGAAITPQINVVLNWFQELTERVPVP